MMGEFRMPSLGADMEDAKLVEWLKKPGDQLKRGDIVAVVETEKGAIEIEAYEDCILEEQLVAPGAVLPVGAVMAHTTGGSEPLQATLTPGPTASIPPQADAEATPHRPAAPPPTVVGSRASPAARRLAQETGVDLAILTGTGPGGAITRADVEAAKTAPAAAKAAGLDLSAMRRAIAAAMAKSKREIPHYYLSHTVDLCAAQDWLTAENSKRPPADRILIGALFVKAVAKAARAFPEFNGFFVGDRFQPSEAIHAGVAIAIRGGGLAAPAIHDAADLDVPALMTKMRDLVGRVRAGRFRSSEIADPTITITSLGDRGVEAVWGVIYPPQVAIVGFGRIVTRPWVVGDAIAVRPTVCVTLGADHRASDGHRGALFLEKIAQLLGEPGAL